MQEVNVIFNPNYVSSGEYVKIAFVMPRGNGETFDFFSITWNKATRHAEAQRKCGANYKGMKSAVYGRNHGKILSLEDALKDKENYDIYRRCTWYLQHSYNRFSALVGANYPETTKNEILEKIGEVKRAFSGDIPEDAENDGGDKWETVDINDKCPEELTGIINALSESKGEETDYNGKTYRFCSVDGKNVLQVKNTTAALPETEFSGTVRKFIRMAKIVNAENLSNIVAGNFYPVLDEKSIENQHYYTIDVCGNPVSLRKDRIKIVNVFTEAPA